jgi:hypothetical protein
VALITLKQLLDNAAGMGKSMHEKKDDFDSRYFLKVATACAQEVWERFIAFGSADHTDKISSVSLSDMAKHYA